MKVPTKIPVGAREDIFLVQDFLSQGECESFVALSEGAGFEQAMISTAMGQVVAKDARNNDRLIWDDHKLAQDWWHRASAFFPCIVWPMAGGWPERAFPVLSLSTRPEVFATSRRKF